MVESDSHDVRLSTKLVWGAVEWIARCKGWSVEGLDELEHVKDWRLEDLIDDEIVPQKGRIDKGAVRILESNWIRFMKLND